MRALVLTERLRAASETLPFEGAARGETATTSAPPTRAAGKEASGELASLRS